MDTSRVDQTGCVVVCGATPSSWETLARDLRERIEGAGIYGASLSVRWFFVNNANGKLFNTN